MDKDKTLEESLDGWYSQILSGQNISEADREYISNKLAEMDREIETLEFKRMEMCRILDYDSNLHKGFSSEEVKKFKTDDDNLLVKVDELRKSNHQKRDYMFGYPSNMEKYSAVTEYMRYVESNLYLMNNCGDPYQRGNYGMDSKDFEQEILARFADSFGLQNGKYWGYITSGGTESNFWAIREGFSRFSKGKLYFSEETHYSVEKYVLNSEWGKVYPYEKVKCLENGSMDLDCFKKMVQKDIGDGVDGIILVLTWGTTKGGAIDPVKQITDFLIEKNINYYCHVDAALYGGISKNQENSPALKDITKLGIDSISLSLHKFFGISRVNGVLLALNRDKRDVVDYIGQEDSTLLGSRDFMPYSTYQRVMEILYRKDKDYYYDNVRFFENLLRDNNIRFEQSVEHGNIFIIDKPSEMICRKYQLSDFKGHDGRCLSHIIIFPFHEKEIMRELVKDISDWQKG